MFILCQNCNMQQQGNNLYIISNFIFYLSFYSRCSSITIAVINFSCIGSCARTLISLNTTKNGVKYDGLSKTYWGSVDFTHHLLRILYYFWSHLAFNMNQVLTTLERGIANFLSVSWMVLSLLLCVLCLHVKIVITWMVFIYFYSIFFVWLCQCVFVSVIFKRDALSKCS